MLVLAAHAYAVGPQHVHQRVVGDAEAQVAQHMVAAFTEAAHILGADGIHLPLWKLREAAEKKQLDGFTTIGVSVHAANEALEALSLGATYLTAGHIYATDCKKGLPPRGTAFLREICQTVSIPVYAIGGIRLEAAQIREVMSCGAVGGCIMSGMMAL